MQVLFWKRQQVAKRTDFYLANNNPTENRWVFGAWGTGGGRKVGWRQRSKVKTPPFVMHGTTVTAELSNMAGSTACV